MSVGTLVTFRDREPQTEYLPLATEVAFQRYWRPLAQSENLQWIPLFADGVSLTKDVVPEVIEEVVILQKAIAAASLRAEQKAEMLNRAERLKSLLENLNFDEVEEIFIG